MARIVSLIPSSTEIVAALGFADDLVGRSHECDMPEAVRALPACTKPKFEPDGTSYQIDERVKAILQESLSVYRVDGELLKDLAPDIIITQSQCEVCAVSPKEVERVVCDWLEARPQLVTLEPNSLDDVWNDFRRVAAALNAPERGVALVEESRQRMQHIAERAGKIEPRPSVACIEWLDPLMAAGNWMPTLVDMAGGENVFGEAGAHSPWLDWDALSGADPDILVVLPCGYGIEKTLEEMPALTQDSRWESLNAVQHDRVFVADGNQYFNRPGPRLIESLEILAEILHPSVFTFGHEGTGWIQFPERNSSI